KQLSEAGLDAGADTIGWHLAHQRPLWRAHTVGPLGLPPGLTVEEEQRPTIGELGPKPGSTVRSSSVM
ncbi:MAG TPA: hypothetical protein VFW69_01620, partial [Mycobacterium sp.]|nr:hypothetical protein [Mycobacterium sp.]